MDTTNEKYVDIETVMDYLDTKKKTIYKWVYESRITGFPYYKIGRYLRFKLSEIEFWIQKYKKG